MAIEERLARYGTQIGLKVLTIHFMLYICQLLLQVVEIKHYMLGLANIHLCNKGVVWKVNMYCLMRYVYNQYPG